MTDPLDDPRPRPTESAPTIEQLEDARPTVAASRARGGLWLTVGAAAALGVLAFVWLATNRDHRAEDGALPTSGSVAARETVASAPPPADLALVEAAGRGGPVVTAMPVYETPPTPPPAMAVAAPPPMPIGAPGESARTPTLVVDFAASDGAAESAATGASAKPGTPPPAGAQAAGGKPGTPGATGLNADEQFASRVSAQEPAHTEATQLHHRATLIPQGTTITGVLETALDSDLPGYTRAVVSRDVRGFDGSEILIPRGSRVIGEYKSAVAQGQTRAFVIWTRVIRPDGVSIQIASSGTDPLGRAGLAGKVNTHFFERFSGAILLSVVDAGVENLANRSNNTSIVIGSSGDAATASLSALVPTAIPPTIRVKQGAAIRIFVARDLDFSTVQRSER
jgi:type IV secretory pathway VirB10-like protein